MTQRPRPHLRLVGSTAAPREPNQTNWSLLMTSAQAGDGAAYKQLLENVAPYLRALAARRLPAQSDVEDVVQDILLTVHIIRATYDPALPFGPWLKAIAMRRINDRLRYQYRRNAHEREILDDEDFAAEENANVNALDHDELRDAVCHLSPTEQQAIGLLKLDEMSLKEASAKSGMSVAALKIATHRGMARLRAIWIKREEL
ncbi:MAG: sigma-70 family RNA polymerase sigma factor [Aestuariivirga sp.]